MLSFGRCVLCWLPFSLEGFDLIKGMGVKGDTSISSKKQRGKDSAVKEDRHGHFACNALHSWKTNGKRASGEQSRVRVLTKVMKKSWVGGLKAN